MFCSNQPWVSLLPKCMPPIEGLVLCGSKALKKIQNKLTNAFWCEVLKSWEEFCTAFTPDATQMLTERIWFSDISKFKCSIIKLWDKKGIMFIADLINNETGTILSKTELEQRYGIRMTFLCYASLIRSLPKTIKENTFKSKMIYPTLPYKIGIVKGKQKISRSIYKAFINARHNRHTKSQALLENKWKRDIGEFQVGSMLDIHLATKNTYMMSFHFRIISRIIATNRFLYIIKKAESSSCQFVQQLKKLFITSFGNVEKHNYILHKFHIYLRENSNIHFASKQQRL